MCARVSTDAQGALSRLVGEGGGGHIWRVVCSMAGTRGARAVARQVEATVACKMSPVASHKRKGTGKRMAAVAIHPQPHHGSQ